MARCRLPLGRVVHGLYQRPASAVGASIVLLFLLLTLFGPLISPYSPTAQIAGEARQGPSWAHFFGTDHLGRDVFSRVVYGSRSILSLTGLGTLLAVGAGTFFGLLSGYLGRWFDEILMRVLDSILAIPALLLALVLLGMAGPSQWSILAVIALVYMPIVARVVRSETLSIKSQGFVEAARLQGERLPRMLFREILPSVLPALSVEAALRFSYGIFLVASLGYLGVGVQPPTPDWGLMVKESRVFVRLTPWALYFPAGAISLLVIGVNLTADGLKRTLQNATESLSPRIRRRILRVRKTTSMDAPNIPTEETPLLAVDHVTVSYAQERRWLDAVRDVTFDVRRGETVGLVGESGSGKSTLALAIVQYLSANGAIRRGSIRFDGKPLLGRSSAEMTAIRGSHINLIPQDPLASLNPSIRVGEQIAEMLRHHRGMNGRAAAAAAAALLARVQIADPEQVSRRYPHQLSGGMQQRITIAMGLSTEPRFLVFDEPTTGLDVTTEATILDLVADLLASGRRSSLYITHDLGVVSRVADRVVVLYAGELVERGPTEALLDSPRHPYSIGLLESVPRIGARRDIRLASMEGSIPSLDQIPSGCVFRPRCAWAESVCLNHPALERVKEGIDVRCVRWQEVVRPSGPAQRAERRAPEKAPNPVPALSAERVAVAFPVPRSLAAAVRGEPRRVVQAVDGLSLSIAAGSTLGLVGESGSGKTSFARAVLGLEPRSGGDLRLGSQSLPPDLRQRKRSLLRRLQAVSQSPDQALNPYLTISATLARPLVLLRGLGRTAARAEAAELLAKVGLTAGYASRTPNQLSGGEKQRVAIARAIAADPDVVICDEATSSLDVSVQARILNLLNDLQHDLGGAYLFITHDLAVVSHQADSIAVLYLGRLMEIGTTMDVLMPPYHPYTEALLAAFPSIDHRFDERTIRLEGEVPSPIHRPSGCPFHTRCPRVVGPICSAQEPPWRIREGHALYCHIPRDVLARDQGSLVDPSDPSDRRRT